MSQRVGFIGLGAIGKPMALSILRKGFPLAVYDVRPEPVAELAAAGARPATSPREVAENSDVLVIMVLNHTQVEDVLAGEHACLPLLAPGKIVIVMATIGPIQTRRLGETVTATGADYLDVAVSGGVPKAAKGELTLMVGGSAEVMERSRPVLGAMGSLIRHIGPRIGDGQVAKICNNLLVSIHLVAAAEVMALGIKAGVDPEALYDVVSHSTGTSWAFANRVDAAMDRDFTKWQAAMRTLYKDVGIALASASELKVPMFLGPVAYQFYHRAVVNGLEGLDDTAVFQAVEEMTGIKIAKTR